MRRRGERNTRKPGRAAILAHRPQNYDSPGRFRAPKSSTEGWVVRLFSKTVVAQSAFGRLLSNQLFSPQSPGPSGISNRAQPSSAQPSSSRVTDDTHLGFRSEKTNLFYLCLTLTAGQIFRVSSGVSPSGSPTVAGSNPVGVAHSNWPTAGYANGATRQTITLNLLHQNCQNG